ncbi:MAG: HEAT repeat domain-containing protein [Proteobacteria bacterium]|nr:HEAT repeat domain-containing protein [Pseudomonadota bacterium]
MTYLLHSDTITFDAALRDIDSKNYRVRAQAAHALGHVVAADERKRAVSALIRVLGDVRPEVRSEAAIALGELETEAAVAPLIGRFGDAIPVVRQSAAIALGRLGFSSAFDAMARALAEGEPDLRFQAATSLAEIDAERAREPLLSALDDSDGEVVAAAALSLGAIGERRAIDRLIALLDDWSRPATRFDIAYALADLGDERAIEILAEFTDRDDTAWDAVEALEKISTGGSAEGRTRISEILADILAQRSAPRHVVLRAAAAILTMRAEPTLAARKAFLAGLSARKLEHRGLAVQLLGDVFRPRSQAGASPPAAGSPSATLSDGPVEGEWAIAPLEALRKRRAGRRLADEIDQCLAQIRRA